MTFSPPPPPPTPPRPRPAVDSTFADLTAPILLLALGLTGFFLGFAPALAFRGETASMFHSSFLVVVPILVLVAGLIGMAGLIPGERPQLWAATSISIATAATMLCVLVNQGDGATTAWAYWVVFAILLAQIGVALFAIFIGAGVITVTANPGGPPGDWQGPAAFGAPPAPTPRPQFPPVAPQPDAESPGQG